MTSAGDAGQSPKAGAPGAAPEAAEPRLGPGLAAIEKQLAALWKPDEGETPKVRACFFNLIAIVSGSPPPDVYRAVDALGTTHPARSLVVALDQPIAGFEWDVNAVCRREPSGDVVCCERVELRLGKARPERVASLLGALLMPELTTVVWPLSEPGSFPLETLDPFADRWILDTRSFPLDRAARIARSAPGYVADMGWIDAWPWRDLVSRAFDDRALRPMLAQIDAIELAVTGATPTPLPAEARLFAGWLASRLGHEWADGQLRRQAHTIDVRVVAAVGSQAKTDRLERVTLLGRLGDRAKAVTVQRNFAEDTFEWFVHEGDGKESENGHAPVVRHAQHVYPLPDERLIARALDAAEPDRVLRSAIVTAAASP